MLIRVIRVTNPASRGTARSAGGTRKRSWSSGGGELVNSTHSWQQQSDESAKAYRAFTIYRDAGYQRSYRGVAQALGVSTRLIARWGGQYHWVERSRKWDSHLFTAATDARIAEAVKIRVGQAQRATAIMERLLDRLSDAAVAELTPAEIVNLAELGVVLTLASFQRATAKNSALSAWLSQRVKLLMGRPQ